MIVVELEAYEIRMAALVGSFRQLSATDQGSEPRFSEQYAGQLHENHQRSAMAELAVAKHLNVYWGGHVDVYRTMPDVADLEVRYSRREDLKVRPDDTGRIVCVKGLPISSRAFGLVGWCDAEDAKKEKYLSSCGNDGPPAYFIPHKCLQPMESL